tara:strand:- start:250 stop:354 length:105 start_codon:yes stop_codon:yes gene_type:complete
MELGTEFMQIIPIVCIVAAVGIFVGTRVWIMFKK